MQHQTLTVIEINSEKRFIRLSNGHKYLFDDEAASLIHSLRAGETVWLGEGDFRPNTYELRSTQDIHNRAIVVRVAP